MVGLMIISKSVFVALVLMCEVNHKTKFANICSVTQSGIYKTMTECKRATRLEKCVEFSSGEYQLYYDGPKSYTDAMERGRK